MHFFNVAGNSVTVDCDLTEILQVNNMQLSESFQAEILF